MNEFMNKMTDGPRKIAICGHFGCGKTEFAVSLAMHLAGLGLHERLALADLDIENPYFRSRERMDMLERAGIAVYSDPFRGRNGSELQTIDAAVRAPLEDSGCRVILDAGGDYSGAMVLNQFKKYFTDSYQLLCILNKNRPGCSTVRKALGHIGAIERATGHHDTGLVSNTHMLQYTAASDILEGAAFAGDVAEASGIPLLCVSCAARLAPELSGCGFEVFPLGMYMRQSYLDKEV